MTKFEKMTGNQAVLTLGVLNAVGQALVFKLRSDVPVMWIIAVQSLIGCVVVLLWSAGDGSIAKLKEVLRVPKSAWLTLNLRALVCLVGGLGLIYWSYAYLSLTVVSWFMAVPLASIWAYALYKEKLSRYEFIALLVSFIGLVFLSGQHGSDGEKSNCILGFVLVSAGVLVFSLGYVASRSGIESFGERNFNILSNAAIGIYALVIAVSFSELPILNIHLILLLIARGIVLGFASMVFARTIKCLKIARVQILARLENVYIVIMGFSFFGEQFTLMTITGMGLLLLSPIIARRA